MKITFIGAAHQVTGSRTLVEWNEGRYFLVDCGMEQGDNPYEMAEMPVPASMIEHVFLTHAHIDHSGLLPVLVREGFRGSIYATEETINLCSIMLADRFRKRTPLRKQRKTCGQERKKSFLCTRPKTSRKP